MRSTRILMALCLFMLAGASRAEWLLKPDADRVQAGQWLEVTVFVLNDTAAAITEGLPDPACPRMHAARAPARP